MLLHIGPSLFLLQVDNRQSSLSLRLPPPPIHPLSGYLLLFRFTFSPATSCSYLLLRFILPPVASSSSSLAAAEQIRGRAADSSDSGVGTTVGGSALAPAPRSSSTAPTSSSEWGSMTPAPPSSSTYALSLKDGIAHNPSVFGDKFLDKWGSDLPFLFTISGCYSILIFFGGKFWGFPRFVGDCASGHKKSQLGATSEQKRDITDSCSQMILQLHDVYNPNKGSIL
ncbi:hypothetical protein LINPERHAP1_LOCUS26733 [Linum perenne]